MIIKALDEFSPKDKGPEIHAKRTDPFEHPEMIDNQNLDEIKKKIMSISSFEIFCKMYSFISGNYNASYKGIPIFPFGIFMTE